MTTTARTTITLIVRMRHSGKWEELRREDITDKAVVTPKRIRFCNMTFKRETGEEIGWNWRSQYSHRVVEEVAQ